jgi:hypothetical protein
MAVLEATESPAERGFQAIIAARLRPTFLKRSAIYIFTRLMSIYCGHLFFQCNRVCQLRIYINILTLIFAALNAASRPILVIFDRGSFARRGAKGKGAGRSIAGVRQEAAMGNEICFSGI